MEEIDNYQKTEPLQYWFDGQFRRISLQVARIFSSISYAIGNIKNGEYVLRRVPIRYAVTDRQVAHILKNSSENVMFTIPMMTIFLSNVSYARNRVQEPFHVDKVQIYERDYNEETKEYGTEIGGKYTLERIMPVPYDLTYQLDIWTSNQLQKDQIVEQIIVLFNPGLQLQNSTNVFDWTALSELNLQNITWSSRGITVGTSDEIEITSFEFTLETWISPPSILQKQKLINTIITNISTDIEFIKESEESGLQIYTPESDLMSRVIITPNNNDLMIEGNRLYLLGSKANIKDHEGNIFSWKKLLERYGKFRPGISAIAVNLTNNIENWENAVIGNIEFTNEENMLLWSIDPMTLPSNNFLPIKAIINPKKVWPGNGLEIPSAGHRYLITEEIAPSQAWQNFTANKEDIIEFDGTKWNILFNSVYQRQQNNVYYLINEFNNKQLKWDKNIGWSYAIDGTYQRGYWRILL